MVFFFTLYSFESLSFDRNTNDLDIELHPTKPIRLDGDYEINGKVLVLPIVGKGKCKISLGKER